MSQLTKRLTAKVQKPVASSRSSKGLPKRNCIQCGCVLSSQSRSSGYKECHPCRDREAIAKGQKATISPVHDDYNPVNGGRCWRQRVKMLRN